MRDRVEVVAIYDATKEGACRIGEPGDQTAAPSARASQDYLEGLFAPGFGPFGSLDPQPRPRDAKALRAPSDYLK